MIVCHSPYCQNDAVTTIMGLPFCKPCANSFGVTDNYFTPLDK